MLNSNLKIYAIKNAYTIILYNSGSNTIGSPSGIIIKIIGLYLFESIVCKITFGNYIIVLEYDK